MTTLKMGKNMKYDDACNNLSFTMRARECLLFYLRQWKKNHNFLDAA